MNAMRDRGYIVTSTKPHPKVQNVQPTQEEIDPGISGGHIRAVIKDFLRFVSPDG